MNRPHSARASKHIAVLGMLLAAASAYHSHGQSYPNLEVTNVLGIRSYPGSSVKLELRTNGVFVGKGAINLAATLLSTDVTAVPTFLWVPSRSALYVGTSPGSATNLAWMGEQSAAFGGGSATGYKAFSNGGGGASGSNSANFGISFASGNYSFAVGIYSMAPGYNSVAFAQGTASGNASAGIGGTASGDYSFAANRGTAASYLATALGRYNIGGGNPTQWNDADPIFEIGNGASAAVKSNAFTVYKNGTIIMPRQGDILMGEFGN